MNTLYLCPSGISVLEYLKRNNIDTSLESLNDFLKNADESILTKASAEINSLFHMGIMQDDRVVFLSSDTDEGEMAANSLAKKLEKIKGCNTVIKRIKGLQIQDRKEFDRTGIPNLTEVIINEVESNRHYYNIVLNATAGYKAAVPYLTFIGMIFHLPIRYIFERSESIIELPPIPIDFDIERLKRLEPVIDRITSDYMPIKYFRDATGYSYDDIEHDTRDILFREDDFITLRPVGRILYQRYLQIKGNKVYISQIVSKKLEFGSYDKQAFENLFKKMKDPIHLQSKIHPEIKKKGKIDLDCYKGGSTSERIFFYTEDKHVYICEIFMHDEYERTIEQGGLLLEKFENKKTFKEAY